MILIKKYIVFLTGLFLFISGNIVCVNAGADIAVGITVNGEVIETEVSPVVENTEIYECTYGLVELSGCDGIKFNGRTFRDSGMFSMFALYGCSGDAVKFIGCKL